ncbi:MAG: hypothetical protein DCC49_09250 [Acidobacteria bacterium]|nr:MAG: hypothetical protein DCC49_09250 [Acidobacteriota bacterium]
MEREQPGANPIQPYAEQTSFLTPDDVEMLSMMRRFMAEASRLYEVRTGRDLREPVIISQPSDVYELLRLEMAELEQEQLRTVNVDVRHQVLSMPLVYQGTVSGTTIRVAEVFRPAIISNASGLVVAHNHPSGDPTPSSNDVALTRQLRAAGKLLDIELLDHIIIGRGRFVSLRERGAGFDL